MPRPICKHVELLRRDQADAADSVVSDVHDVSETIRWEPVPEPYLVVLGRRRADPPPR